MQQQVQDLLLNILLGLFTLIGLYVLSLIKTKTKEIQDRLSSVKDEAIRKLAIEAFNRVDKLAEDTVLAIEGVTAKKLRKAVKLGDAPRSQLEDLANEAMYEIKDQLGDEYLDALNDSLGDVDKYIKNLVEAKLEMYKAVGINASANNS